MEGAETKKRAREAIKPSASASAAEEDDLLCDDKASFGFSLNVFTFVFIVDARPLSNSRTFSSVSPLHFTTAEK